MNVSWTPKGGVVHPRSVWAAVACSLVGLVTLGVGIIVLSWWVGIGGAAILVAGVIVGLRAGWTHDVQTGPPADREVQELEEGGTRAGTSAGEMVHAEGAELRAAALDQRRRQILASAGTARPPLADLGGWLLLLVALIILVSQWTVYPHTARAQSNGLHALLIGIVVALVGLRTVTSRGRPHPVAAAIGTAAGIILLLLALLAPHTSTGDVWLESICAVGIICGSLALLSWRGRSPNRSTSSSGTTGRRH